MAIRTLLVRGGENGEHGFKEKARHVVNVTDGTDELGMLFRREFEFAALPVIRVTQLAAR